MAAIAALLPSPCCVSASLPISPLTKSNVTAEMHRPARAAAMVSSRVAVNFGALKRFRIPEFGRSYASRGGRGGGGGGGVLARSVWKQEVLWAEAPVADVGVACEEHYHFVLDISGNRELMEGHTTPGQFVQVEIRSFVDSAEDKGRVIIVLNLGVKLGNSKAAFLAIASPPKVATKGSLEFLIKAVEGTTAGNLCNLRKGDKVELSQVMGSGFGMNNVAPAEAFPTLLLLPLVRDSPIRSLLEAGFDAHKRQDVRLYYGARNLDRMSYQDRFKDWESSGVQVVPVLSQPDGSWNGAQGYVQSAFAKTKGIINGAQAGAVLCGHKQMAQDVSELLLAEGVPKERVLLNF